MQFKPHNNLAESLKSFLIPSPAGTILYFLVSIVLLVVFNIKAIWDWLNGNFITPRGSSALPATYTSALDSFWTFISQSRLLQILFWVFVGIIVYSLVWLIWNIVNNLRNDIVAGEYVRPSSYTRANYWRSILESKFILAASSISLLIYLVLLFKLFSVIAELSLSAIDNFRPTNSPILLIGSVLTGVLLLYLLVILGRVAKNSWQSIYKGL